jgi:N-acetylmuramoyl-L-alanine amidase
LFGFVVMLAAALLAAATVFFAAEADAQTTTQGLLSGKTIVIDPGHGGSDLGATYTFPRESLYSGTKLIEKDQNLDVAYKLRKLLRDEGATVVLTREGDQNLTNTQRAEIANKAGADRLVSIHMNGSSDKTVDYTTTLFGKWQKDKAFAYAVFGDNVRPPKINPPTYGLRTLRAANGTGSYIATKAPYSYASGRQQQIAGALKTGVVAHFTE